MLAVLAQEGTPTPAPGPSCSGSGFCEFVYDRTKSTWLAESSYWVLVKPLTILLIVVVALVVRFLVHRTIDRLIRHTIADHEAAGTEATGKDAAGTEAGGNGFSLLRPLRNRMPTALGMPSERREQRARALGSVLRSIASATIFTIALMLILGELGVNLGPLLASAGVAGLAIGFGAQNLVKDFISGLFMLLEDQYGVGDFVDVGDVTGTVEAVGLRITTLRDGQGVLWYVRNGEIIRVGNKSQGWALVIVDVPVGFVSVDQATQVLRDAAAALAEDPDLRDDIIGTPEVLGVEQITAEGAVVRTTVKTASAAQWRVGRELRHRLADALERAGIAAQITAGRMYIRPSYEPSSSDQGGARAAGAGSGGQQDTGQGGAT